MTKSHNDRQDRQAGGMWKLRQACMKAVTVPFLAMIALGCANADDGNDQGRDDGNGSSYAGGIYPIRRSRKWAWWRLSAT